MARETTIPGGFYRLLGYDAVIFDGRQMKKTARPVFMLVAALMACATGCSTIHDAARNGNMDAVKQHLQEGSDVNAKDNNGDTPLMWAAGEGQLEVVKFLVDKGADVNANNKSGWTPLIWAVFEGHLDVVRFLVDKGADVNVRANDGRTPLKWAADRGHLEVVKFLKQHGAKE